MRTRACRKLIDPDPICSSVRPIVIRLPVGHPDIIAAIEVAGIPLSDEEISAFAVNDGFGDGRGSPRFKMGRFWIESHGFGEFHGWVIEWSPP